jgi:hypothetical protein
MSDPSKWPVGHKLVPDKQLHAKRGRNKIIPAQRPPGLCGQRKTAEKQQAAQNKCDSADWDRKYQWQRFPQQKAHPKEDQAA